MSASMTRLSLSRYSVLITLQRLRRLRPRILIVLNLRPPWKVSWNQKRFIRLNVTWRLKIFLTVSSVAYILLYSRIKPIICVTPDATDSKLYDNATNPLAATKVEELIGRSSGSKQSDHSKKPKRRSNPLKRMRHCSDDWIEETSGSQSAEPNKRNREREDEKIRQFYKMFCDLCTSAEFQTFAEAINHYRECHAVRGYLVCCNAKIRRRAFLIDHIVKHRNPDMFRYVAAPVSF